MPESLNSGPPIAVASLILPNGSKNLDGSPESEIRHADVGCDTVKKLCIYTTG